MVVQVKFFPLLSGFQPVGSKSLKLPHSGNNDLDNLASTQTPEIRLPLMRRSMFRIAIPSWRAGSKQPVAPVEERKISRDEIQSLFGGELSSRKFRFRKMTDHEKWQVGMSDRMRDALNKKANLA